VGAASLTLEAHLVRLPSRRSWLLAALLVSATAGVLLRLYLLVLNPSLWVDEAFLALNIRDRSYLQLFHRLDYEQAAPPAFLIVQKMLFTLLGSHDWTLRLLPLLAGIATIALSHALASQLAPPPARLPFAFVATALVALSPSLIRYSLEAKQYGTDATIAFGLFLLGLRALSPTATGSWILLLAITFSASLWFSYPAAFVCTAVLGTLLLAHGSRRDWRRCSWILCASMVVALSAAALYLVHVRDSRSEFLQHYWSFAFAPWPWWTNLRWYYETLASFLNDQAGLPVTSLTVILLFLGAISLFVRYWQPALYLTASLALCFLASTLALYPFTGRLLVFWVPVSYLLLAEGIERCRLLVWKIHPLAARMMWAGMVGFLGYGIAAAAWRTLDTLPGRENIKPILAHLRQHMLEGDTVYVYYGAVPAFRFYAPFYGLDGREVVLGELARDQPERYLEDIETLRDRARVWFVFAHYCASCLVNEREFIIAHLDKTAVKRDERGDSSAALYLYDMRRTE